VSPGGFASGVVAAPDTHAVTVTAVDRTGAVTSAVVGLVVTA